MLYDERDHEMVLSALDRSEQFYLRLYDSTTPRLEGLKKTAKLHRKLAKRLRKDWGLPPL